MPEVARLERVLITAEVMNGCDERMSLITASTELFSVRGRNKEEITWFIELMILSRFRISVAVGTPQNHQPVKCRSGRPN